MSEGKPRRPRFRFGLRTLLVLVTVLVAILGWLALIAGARHYFQATKRDFMARHNEASKSIEEIYSYFHTQGHWPEKEPFEAGPPSIPPDWNYETDPESGDARLWLHGPHHMILSYRFQPPLDKSLNRTWDLSEEGDKTQFQSDNEYLPGVHP